MKVSQLKLPEPPWVCCWMCLEFTFYCVCLCLCYKSVNADIYAYHKLMLGVFLYWSLPYFLRHFLLEPVAYYLGKIVDKSQGSSCLCLSSVGNLSSDPCVVRQVLFWLSCLHSLINFPSEFLSLFQLSMQV